MSYGKPAIVINAEAAAAGRAAARAAMTDEDRAAAGRACQLRAAEQGAYGAGPHLPEPTAAERLAYMRRAAATRKAGL